MRNQQAFSIVELLVTMAIFIIFFTIFIITNVEFQKGFKETKDNIYFAKSASAALPFLQKQLQSSYPSFYGLQIDASTPSSAKFFDYYPDYFKENDKREKALTNGNTILFLKTQNQGSNALKTLEPNDFYNGTSFDATAFETVIGGTDNDLFLFYVPIPIRDTDAQGNSNIQNFPKWHAYLAKKNGNQYIKATTDTSYFDNGSHANVDSFFQDDKFPQIGGARNIVIAQLVEGIAFSIRQGKLYFCGNLNAEVINHWRDCGADPNNNITKNHGVIIIDSIQELKFTRQNTADLEVIINLQVTGS